MILLGIFWKALIIFLEQKEIGEKKLKINIENIFLAIILKRLFRHGSLR